MQEQPKVCLVTGANSGIGGEVAVQLARQGATVIVACRDERAATQARGEVAALAGRTMIETLAADLSCQRQVRRLAAEFQARHERLDLLVNNAGANFARRTLTEDGVEATFAVNAVAPFLLTELLAAPLKRAAPARVVNVASGMLSAVEWEHIVRREGRYRQMAAYAQSKMALVLATGEQAGRLTTDGVTAVSMTPGMVGQTGLGRDVKGGLRLFLKLMTPFMRSPQQAAADILSLATRPPEALRPGAFYKRRDLERRAELENPRNLARAAELLLRSVSAGWSNLA